MKRDDDLFADALELPAAERAAFLDRACAGDPAQRARLDALLAAHDSARSFLERPLTDRPPPPAEEAPDTVIGPYTLRQRLGEGGCGVVWLAEQTSPLRRLVALKVIKPGMDSRSVIARFEAERQALARMNHPDIARVYDAGTTAHGRPYFVMEYVEGVPITRFCDEHSLDMTRRLELFARVCLALQHAHQKGLIHRDLKPSNILVALRDGEPAPKVIDFGIAKATEGRLTPQTLHTELGQLLGTPAYMSPEQAEFADADLDTRSDVYALGVLLYELLTGRPPYDPKELVRAGLVEIRRIIREVDPPRPSTAISTLTKADRATVARLRGSAAPRLSAALRGDLDWIVMRCLEKDRDRRYGTAAALAEDIRRHLRQEPVEARPPHLLYRLRKFVARHRLLCASAALVTLTLLGGISSSTLQARRAVRAERQAAAARDIARRRQDQAEDLLAFMLGDFRTELQKIGRLNLLDAVGEKAMAYFAALDPQDLTDTALTRQTKALTQIGEIRMEQARYPEAEQAFTTAYARAAALATRHPANGDMIFERGQAEFWIGYVARRRGNRSAEREWLVRYRDSALALLAAEGPTPRAKLEVIYGHHNLAVNELEAGNLTDAQTGFRAERDTVESMLATQPADPDLLYRMADTTSWLGTIAERDGRFAEAATHYADMARRYDTLGRLEPKVARWRFELAQSLTFAGRIALITGRQVEAAGSLTQAMLLLQELVAQDPANKRWLDTKLNLQLQQAMPQPDRAPALAAVREAREGLDALVVAEPGSLFFSRSLTVALTLEARLQLTQGPPDEAAATVARAQHLAEVLLKDAKADTWVRHEAAHALIMAGRIAQARGQPAEAQAAWLAALAALGPDAAGSRDWRVLEPAALAARLAGRAGEASALIARLKTFGYVSPDPLNAATLTPADATGTSNPSHP